MEKINILETWKNYKTTKDEKEREKIITYYLPLVKYNVDKIIQHLPEEIKKNDKDDLYIEGAIGLIEAIDRFDLKKNVKFETFAVKRIRGAILDVLRKEDLLPKNVREQIKKIEDMYIKLETELGRVPTDEEVISRLGMTREKFYDIINKAKSVSLFSIETEIFNKEGEKFYLEDILGEEDKIAIEYEKKEIINKLAQIIDNLDKIERMILEMYYWDGLTLKEIGKVLNLSESRVCQLHTKIILKIRSKFRKLEKVR